MVEMFRSNREPSVSPIIVVLLSTLEGLIQQHKRISRLNARLNAKWLSSQYRYPAEDKAPGATFCPDAITALVFS